jgi:tRNA-Thr(GGU) m(6)t(6)A37 methyltransferase TsaA
MDPERNAGAGDKNVPLREAHVDWLSRFNLGLPKPNKSKDGRPTVIQNLSDMHGIKFRPVGIVHTKASDEKIKKAEENIESIVDIYPEFQDALEGIDGFSHIFVLGYFHKLRPDQIGPLKVNPRRFLRRGFKLEELPLIGVFALDSPTRPNPIGLALVRLVKREGNKLFVTGLDYFDGTPVLDIKPYGPDRQADDFTLPEWRLKLMSKMGHT